MSEDDKVSFNPLNISGRDWDSPVEWPRHRTPAMEAVERSFRDAAQKALREAGFDALVFLASNRGTSMIELAQQLAKLSRCRLSARGLIMAVYHEAAQKAVVRETAKDLLIRNILARFPDGWSSQGNVRPVVKIGSWYSDVARFAGDPRFGTYAKELVRELAMLHPPPERWKPQVEKDHRIDGLFDRYWPVEPKVAE